MDNRKEDPKIFDTLHRSDGTVIGAFSGFILGFAIRLFIEFLIVECEESKSALIENILWSHFALGVAKIK